MKKFKTDTTKMGRQYITKVLNLQTKKVKKQIKTALYKQQYMK